MNSFPSDRASGGEPVAADDGSGSSAPGSWAKANASLIDAAPALLEALQWLVALLPDPDLDPDEVQAQLTRNAIAAIVKAGSQP